MSQNANFEEGLADSPVPAQLWAFPAFATSASAVAVVIAGGVTVVGLSMVLLLAALG